MSFLDQQQQRTVSGLRNKIGLVLGLRLGMALLSAWLFAWAAGVLVLRAVTLLPWQWLLCGMVGVVAAAVVAVLAGVRRRPSEDTVRALLDERAGCGGLLMTAGEMEIGGWQKNLSQTSPPVPRVQWRGRRQWGILAASAAFLLASFLMPAQFLAAPGSQRLQVGKEVEKLKEQIALLAEEKILPPDKVKNLEESLAQLQQESSGNDPAKTWEAIDHLEQSIARAGAEGAEVAAHNAQKAAQAEELAEALQRAQDKMAAEQLAEAMKSLANQVDKMNADNAEANEISEQLQKALKEAGQNGELNPEQLQQLAEALKECKAGDLAQLRKLADAKIIDPADLAECEGQCEIDPEALAELLILCQGDKEGPGAEDILALWEMQAGRGGITRGPGAAAMTWRDPANKEGVEFKEQLLPRGTIASLKDSKQQGVSVGAPTASKPGNTASGGVLDGSLKGSGSARTQVILPEHKAIVQRYFERGRSAKEPVAQEQPAQAKPAKDAAVNDQPAVTPSAQKDTP